MRMESQGWGIMLGTRGLNCNLAQHTTRLQDALQTYFYPTSLPGRCNTACFAARLFMGFLGTLLGWVSATRSLIALEVAPQQSASIALLACLSKKLARLQGSSPVSRLQEKGAMLSNPVLTHTSRVAGPLRQSPGQLPMVKGIRMPKDQIFMACLRVCLKVLGTSTPTDM